MLPVPRQLPLYVVDAFTDQVFRGNPAAVCILDSPRDAHWMQSVAAEMNLSETAFLVRSTGAMQLRWFTPTIEVDLCGHATLATAHILFETGLIPGEKHVVFETASGKLTCFKRDSWIEMDFPAERPVPADHSADLLVALKADGAIVSLMRNRLDYLVEIADARSLRRLKPDMGLLAKLPVRGIIVTARSNDPDFDFVSRFFAPAAGINEDPVTGSAHCCLGPYWGEILRKKELIGFQASRRGGIVRVSLCPDRVILAGQAVTVLRAHLAAG